jgi:hypothetical protein
VKDIVLESKRLNVTQHELIQLIQKEFETSEEENR